MRHRLDKKSFNRDTKARSAMLEAIALGVLEHGEVLTTKAKAGEARRLVEHSIKLAQKKDLATRRVLHRIYGKRSVVNNLCDRVAPAMKDRTSGFTKITLVGNRRGDNALLYKLALVEALPPTKKKEQEVAAKVKQIAAKNPEKKGLFGRKKDADLAAQQAVKLDQGKVEKIKANPTALKAQNTTTARTSVSGGRGK